MNIYHKINTVFKRDTAGKIIEGDWSQPEFEYLAYNMWTFTEKVDGTNIRIMWDGHLRFGGKTDNAQLPAKLVHTLNSTFNPPLFKDFDEICLYGEGYGAGIQKGGVYRPDQNFVLFDVKIGRWWLKREDVEKIGEHFCIDVVPVVGSGTLLECINKIKSGMKSTWGDFISEGIVARPQVEMMDRGGNRIIAKIKHKDFQGINNANPGHPSP